LGICLTTAYTSSKKVYCFVVDRGDSLALVLLVRGIITFLR